MHTQDDGSGSNLRPGARLRQRLALRSALPVIGIYDVFSASIASRYFEAVFLSGYGFTASYYGLPDEGFVKPNDIVDCAGRIRSVVDSTHLIVDIDDGYGDENTAAEVARRLEEAGVSAVLLEDQMRPKKCGHLPGKEVVPIDVYLGRLSAVLEARQDLFIVARTDATDEQGLERAEAYANAGADAVMVEGLSHVDELSHIRERVPDDIFLVTNLIRGGKTPPVALETLEQCGANLVIYSTPCLFPVHAVLEDTMRMMQDNDCVLDESLGRIQLDDNNKILLDNLLRAGPRVRQP